jgi:hypothetical protein
MRTAEIRLQHNRPQRIAGRLRIECVAGRVWLTCSGRTGDVFLGPGDNYVLDRSETALLEALADMVGDNTCSAHIMLHVTPPLWRRIVSRVRNFFLSYADRRASQYSGIHLRVVRFPGRRDSMAG